MSESIENLIEVTNDNIKSESESESENDIENDTKPTIETPIKFNRKSKSI